MNNRRKLIIALGATALASPLSPLAQPTKVWRVGFLSPRSRPSSLESDRQMGGLLKGLRELGYVEGKNLIIEWRFVDGKNERFHQRTLNNLVLQRRNPERALPPVGFRDVLPL